MPQLKVLINRTSVPKKPGENMKAAEDFLDVVIEAHVIAAANSVPNKERITSAQEVAEKMVKSFESSREC